MVWTSELDFPGSSYRCMGSPKMSFFSAKALTFFVQVDDVFEVRVWRIFWETTIILSMVGWLYLVWQPPHHPGWPEWNHVRWRRESPGCLRSGSGYLLEERGLSWTSYPRRADRLDCLHEKLCSSVAEICSSANRCLPAKTLEIPSAPEYGKTRPSTYQELD